jgi:hypothetical protein
MATRFGGKAMVVSRYGAGGTMMLTGLVVIGGVLIVAALVIVPAVVLGLIDRSYDDIRQ